MNYSQLLTFAPLMVQGLLMTIALWLSAAFIGITLGALIGIAQFYSQSRSKCIARCITGYIFILRGIPVYVQLLIVYFVLPTLLPISVSSFTAAITSLGLCSSAYVAEIVRSGLKAIPKGQWDAAFVLGYNPWNTLCAIIVPQMLYSTFPTLANELEALLKSTAILSTIGVVELTKIGSNIIARYLDPLPIYLIIACLYLLLSAALKASTNYCERRFFTW